MRQTAAVENAQALINPAFKTALELVNLPPLMELTAGRPEIVIGLVDGPVTTKHADLASSRIQAFFTNGEGACTDANSLACLHGTFVATMLCAGRGSFFPGICPGGTLFVRPVLKDAASGATQVPRASPEKLAEAISDCIRAGAHVINLSLSLEQPSLNGEQGLQAALDEAAKRGVLIVAAAGNQGTVGSSVITRHPWVIPVAGCDLQGRPIRYSNLGASIGGNGLMAPGEGITRLGANGRPFSPGGTSVATPFVTGAVALLWSAFPAAGADQVKLALTGQRNLRRGITPPALNAWRACQTLSAAHSMMR